MNVLSLFDGMSCGIIALEKTGIKVENYFSSEIDEKAIRLSQHNYPNIIRLGDVTKWRDWKLPNIDLIIGGSPCQSFSINGNKKGFDDDRGSLLNVFFDVKNELGIENFLFENVGTMSDENKNKIDDISGVNGFYINSGDFCPQNRKRYYWTNIQIKEVVKENKNIMDILEDYPKLNIYPSEKLDKHILKESETNGVITLNPRRKDNRQTYQQDRIYLSSGKMPALTANLANRFYIKDKGIIRKLTIRELARLQTIPDEYDFSVVSDLSASKAIGNGWTVDVIKHILGGLK